MFDAKAGRKPPQSITVEMPVLDPSRKDFQRQADLVELPIDGRWVAGAEVVEITLGKNLGGAFQLLPTYVRKKAFDVNSPPPELPFRKANLLGLPELLEPSCLI